MNDPTPDAPAPDDLTPNDPAPDDVTPSDPADIREQVPTLAALRPKIEDRDDEEILEGIERLGTDVVLGYLFATALREAFVPDRAPAAVVQFDVATADGPRAYHVRVAPGAYEAAAGAAADPTATLALGVPDLLRLVTGLRGLAALEAAGAARVTGAAAVAQAVPTWFRATDKAPPPPPWYRPGL